MAGQPQAYTLPKGYIVKNFDGRFLTRSMNWARHHGKPDRAFVHPKELLLGTQDWMSDADQVYLAQYNPVHDHTEVVGNEPLSFEKFAAYINSNIPLPEQFRTIV